MRVNVNCVVSLTDSSGIELPRQGWVNVFRTAGGRLLTGKKAYPTLELAESQRRSGESWTFLGTIRLEEYVDSVDAAEIAKKAVIAAYDASLAARFFPVVVEAEPTVVLRKRAISAIKKRTTVGSKKKVVAKKKVAPKKRK